MKTIGVLGGLGPQATMDFEDRIHRVSQQLISHEGNVVYPPMIVSYFREIPVIMPPDGSMPTAPPPVNPHLLDAASKLGPLVDFLVITSNGIHMYQQEIEQAAGRPVLSMIEVTLDEVQQRGLKRVGILDFRPFSLYHQGLMQRGITSEGTPQELQPGLMQAMMAVVEGRADAVVCRNVDRGVEYLRSRQVDGIIPACTEFPLALGAGNNAPDLVNPAQLLAEAAVRHSLE